MGGGDGGGSYHSLVKQENNNFKLFVLLIIPRLPSHSTIQLFMHSFIHSFIHRLILIHAIRVALSHQNSYSSLTKGCLTDG